MTKAFFAQRHSHNHTPITHGKCNGHMARYVVRRCYNGPEIVIEP